MSNANASPQAVLEAYIEGTATRNIDLLKSIFAEGAMMSGWLGPDLMAGGPEPFYGALEANEVGSDYVGTIANVTETDRIATGEINESNLLGLSFNNHFQMVQDGDGNWTITAKLFRHH